MPKETQLVALAQRRKLRVPPTEYRVDRRGLWQFFEVRERWEGQDPKCYSETIEWFKGKNDRPGKPRGAQFWLDLCAHCGQDRVPYEELSANDPMKITVEHWYSQSMAGDRHGLLHGWMNLHAVEWGFNNTLDFKSCDSPAEQQFLGLRAYRMHRSFLNWFNTSRNSELPTLAFLQSTYCTDTDMTTPIYLSSGLRHSGLTRQLFLPFGAAQGLRSGVKRARVEEVVEEAQEEAEVAQEEAPAQEPAPEPMTREVATQTEPDEVLSALKSAIAQYEAALGPPPDAQPPSQEEAEPEAGEADNSALEAVSGEEDNGDETEAADDSDEEGEEEYDKLPSGDKADERPPALPPPPAKVAAGNRRVVKLFRCTWPGCNDGFNRARQSGYTQCGKKGGVRGCATGCIAKAQRLEAKVGKKPNGMRWSAFLKQHAEAVVRLGL